MTIEYVTAQWNPYTGCLHGKDICATVDTCWARDMSRRFKQVCGGDFQPRYFSDRLDIPYQWHKPRRVAVSFMGDLFGDWEWADDGSLPGSEPVHMDIVRRFILNVVWESPQHTFLFLTKQPKNLAQWNPWPENAWVGCSITGAETPERRDFMLSSLRLVKAPIRWISYEPMLAELPIPFWESWIDWVVFGAQSGRGGHKLEPKAVRRQTFAAAFLGIPIWEKDNLSRYLNGPLMQELPVGTGVG